MTTIPIDSEEEALERASLYMVNRQSGKQMWYNRNISLKDTKVLFRKHWAYVSLLCMRVVMLLIAYLLRSVLFHFIFLIVIVPHQRLS